jgi:PST family polysaccharide transporter
MVQFRGKLLAGAGWLGASRLAVNLLGFLSTVVLARVLTPDDFGLVALGMAMTVMISAITDTSLASALVQHENPGRDHCNTILTLGIIRGLLAAGLFALAAYPISNLFKEPRLVGVMQVLAISLVLNGFANPRSILMTKQLIFWQQFMLQVSSRLTQFLVSVVLALIYRNYWALILGTVIGQAVSVAISYSVLPYRPRLGLKHVRELLGFSVWLTLGNIVSTANWRIDHLLIGGFLSRSTLGLYAMGDNFAVMPTREVRTPLLAMLFPAFTHVVRSRGKLVRNYQRAQATFTCVVLPLGIGAALVADPVMPMLLGQKWRPAVLVVQILASVYAIQTLGSLAQPLAMAAGRTRLLFISDLQNLVLRVPIVVVGLFAAGLPGVLWARAISGSIGIGFNMAVVRSVTGLRFREQLAGNGRAFAAAGVMACGVMLGRSLLSAGATRDGRILEIVAIVALGAALYVGTLLALWLPAGKPDGPETEILKTFQLMRSRLPGQRNVRPAGGVERRKRYGRAAVAFSRDRARMATGDPHIDSQKDLLRDAVAGLLYPGQDYALVGFPNYANVGDSAIWLGARALLEEVTGRPPAYVSTTRDFDATTFLRAVPSGPIIIKGGGNVGDIWPWQQDFRERLLAGFPDRQIIQLPQSIKFNSEERARHFAELIARYGNFTLMVRDAGSLRFAREMLGIDAWLLPDCAMFLGPQRRTADPEFATVVLLRTDAERNGVRWQPFLELGNSHLVDWADEPKRWLGAGKRAWLEALARGHFRASDRRLSYFDRQAEWRLQRGLWMLSQGNVVITDRLHAHILSLLLDLPHITLDNSYGKVSGYVDAWTRGYRRHRSAATAEMAIDALAELA